MSDLTAALADALHEKPTRRGCECPDYAARVLPRFLSDPRTAAALALDVAEVKYEADPEDADHRFARRILAALQEPTE